MIFPISLVLEIQFLNLNYLIKISMIFQNETLK
jgi:hypothetical protein